MHPLGEVMKRYDDGDVVGGGGDDDDYYCDASGTVGIAWPIHVDRRWRSAFEWHSLLLLLPEHDVDGVRRSPATLKRVTLIRHSKSCCCSSSCSAAGKIHSSAADDDCALQPPPPLHFALKSIGQHSIIHCCCWWWWRQELL